LKIRHNGTEHLSPPGQDVVPIREIVKIVRESMSPGAGRK
jgi:hypothetical protein